MKIKSLFQVLEAELTSLLICTLYHTGVYDNQMDRSRQEFAAMYDVRVGFQFYLINLSFEHWLCNYIRKFSQVTELQTELGRERERASVS